MAMDLDNMLTMIKDRQWALADIDWDAPGAELIDPDLHAKLKPFLSDLMWIENVGARGFAAMARKAPTPTLKSIYEHFHAEEQKHANAELALMRRWGMLDDDEIPSPNINVQLVINWLDQYSDGMSLSFLGTVIPMLEVALDGALIKFITDEVKDPSPRRCSSGSTPTSPATSRWTSRSWTCSATPTCASAPSTSSAAGSSPRCSSASSATCRC